MGLLKWAIAAGAAYTGITLFSKVDAAKKLMYNITGYRVRSGKIEVDLQLTNPTRQNYTLSYIFLDMIAGGRVVAQARQEKLEATYIFPPEQTTVRRIVFKPLLGAFLTTLATAAIKGSIPGAVQVYGYVKANDLRLPVDETIQFIADKPAAAPKPAAK